MVEIPDLETMTGQVKLSLGSFENVLYTSQVLIFYPDNTCVMTKRARGGFKGRWDFGITETQERENSWRAAQRGLYEELRIRCNSELLESCFRYELPGLSRNIIYVFTYMHSGVLVPDKTRISEIMLTPAQEIYKFIKKHRAGITPRSLQSWQRYAESIGSVRR